VTNKTAIGLMSGTSLDGVDAAVLITDGETIAGFGAHQYRAYDAAERDVLRRALSEARQLTDRRARPGALAEAERVVTDAHGDAVERLMRDNHLTPASAGDTTRGAIDLIGFHGQTVFHAPERRLTVQIGDAAQLAARTGIPVVHDFRAADVAAGGEGAPFVPAYHRALVRQSGLAGTIAVVNIGGVANVTRIGDDGTLVAGDTGPGNALLDDFMRVRTGIAMDKDGERAARGTADQAALATLLANPWFGRRFPKSLDRNAFSAAAVAQLGTDDGAATLTAFTAGTIAKGIALAGGAEQIVIAGGGSHNRTLLAMIERAAATPVVSADELDWSADFIEAEAFAFLAVRSLAGLPLSYPETTGVPQPMPGGVLALP
jgi:anhydro-N-acetylmuramic acid kinase